MNMNPHIRDSSGDKMNTFRIVGKKTISNVTLFTAATRVPTTEGEMIAVRFDTNAGKPIADLYLTIEEAETLRNELTTLLDDSVQ
jgi:hypothetical protein